MTPVLIDVFSFTKEKVYIIIAIYIIQFSLRTLWVIIPCLFENYIVCDQENQFIEKRNR